MPRVTTGNTMAPCVVIGERAAVQRKGDANLFSTHLFLVCHVDEE